MKYSAIETVTVKQSDSPDYESASQIITVFRLFWRQCGKPQDQGSFLNNIQIGLLI